MGQRDLGRSRQEGPLEARITRVRIGYLAGLVVFAAKDQEIVIGTWREPEVLIRIGGIPEERVGHSAWRDAPRNHVARIERQLGLKKCGAHSLRDAGDRVVSRDDDV